MPRPVLFEGKTILVPDDATDAEIAQLIEPQTQQQSPQSKALEFASNPARALSNGGIGIVEGGLQMATGLGSSIFGGLAGLAGTVLPGPEGQGAQWAQNIQEAGTYQPRSDEGKGVSALLSAPFELASRGTGYVGGKIGGALGNEAAGQTIGEVVPPIAATLYGGAKTLQNTRKVAQAQTIEQQKALDIAKAQNAERDAVLQAARDKGFVFTPDEVSKVTGGKNIAKAAEHVSNAHLGMQQSTNFLDKTASIRNVKLAEDLARQDLTLPNGQPVPKSMSLGEKSLQEFREKHVGSYKAVEGLKEPIKYTPEYANAVLDINGRFAAAKAQYPDAFKNDGLVHMQNILLNPEHVSTNGKAVVQMVQKLREEANKTFKSSASKAEDLAIADIKKSAAKVLEDLVEQHLKTTGKTALFDAFQNSRKNMAMAYEIERSLKGNRLSPLTMAGSEAPLTGNLELIRQMARNHPNIMQDISTMKGGSGGAITNAIIGGPLARAAILSKPSQGMFANPSSYQASPIVAPRISPALGMMGYQTEQNR